MSLRGGVTTMTASETLRLTKPALGTAGEPFAALWLWLRRQRERAALRRLLADPHLLADTGLDRAAVQAEAAKPFWVA